VSSGVCGTTLPIPPVAPLSLPAALPIFPFASFTITDGGEPTAAPAVPGWLVGLFAAIVAAAPAVAVAVKITGLPVSPLAVARAEFVRAPVRRPATFTSPIPPPFVDTDVH